VVCFFARGIYQPELVVRALQTAGVDLTLDDLSRIGRTIHQEKYQFKFREGFSIDDLRLPKRIFETPALVSGWDEAYLREALACFREALDGCRTI
jgi:aldehyde:ferredoxin oxidoreductase